MEQIIKYAFEAGALNQVILAVIALAAVWFLFIKWWPEQVKKSKRKDEFEHAVQIAKIDTRKELRLKEIGGQIDVYNEAVGNIKQIQLSVDGLQATYNDFLQNILSQYMEERSDFRELIDTGVFREKDRK